MTAPPLILQWGRERYFLKYDETDLQETTLGQFKEVCREVTGVPATGMKIIFSGATMKDDNSPLAYYGVYPGATIRMLGRKHGDEKSAPVTEEEREENALINKIDHISNETSDLLLSRMQSYLADAQLYIDQFLSGPVDGGDHDKALAEIRDVERKKLNDSYLFINETLMQGLLKIDGVVCPPEADRARQRRRQAVRLLQSWMDQMDRKKESVREAEKEFDQK